MRVLVACEFSGIVREAFRKRGHDAYSCDLLKSGEAPPRQIAHISRDRGRNGRTVGRLSP